jgi:DNA-binding NtrC family response regulator
MLAHIARAAALVAEAAMRSQARGFRWMRCGPFSCEEEAKGAMAEASRRVRELGFVPLRASARVSRDEAQGLLHRHVVVFVMTEVDRQAAIDWIWKLSRASPRSHLVVDMSCSSRESVSPGLPSERTDIDTACRLIAAGDLAGAEAILAAATVAARIQGVATSDGVRLALGQLYFWQGRFEEAAAQLSRSSIAAAETVAWRELIAWARGDGLALQRLVRSLTSPSGLPSLSPALDRAVMAESLITTGRADRALEILGPVSSRMASQVEDALLARLQAACGASTGEHRAIGVRRYVQRTGAVGIMRWGMGRSAMSVLHAVPALLQLVQESDDDLVTLRRGCAWMRKHTGADAVGVVTADARALLAADGLTDADLSDGAIAAAVAAGAKLVATVTQVIVTSPVRYGGATIGAVLAKGRPEVAETLSEAAAAVAALLGGAVRARLDAVALAGSHHAVAPEILGRSPSIGAVREAIARAAGTNFAVLIEGESGTGKELVARALHRLSARRHRRLAAVNCAALTDELIEAELFGHVRGAFTGAVGARTGLFEEAHGGTLFLDEVSELSARGQAKLLRALQEREIRRLGENAVRPVDVRVIAAANVPLADAVAHGRFREDLLFRLAVVRVRMPSLRDRIEDVPLLAQAFWRPLLGECGKRAALGPDAMAELCRHHWPGNVRELQNVMAALSVTAPARGLVRARHVSAVLAGVTTSSAGPVARLEVALRGFERQVVSSALARHSGRRQHAARELGLTRQGLTKAIRRLGLAADGNTEGVA